MIRGCEEDKTRRNGNVGREGCGRTVNVFDVTTSIKQVFSLDTPQSAEGKTIHFHKKHHLCDYCSAQRGLELVWGAHK